MRVALAQINVTVGDIEGNKRKILRYVASAKDAGAHIVVFPEMAITGYPPEDLLLKPDFIQSAMDSLREIAAGCSGLTALVGTLSASEDLTNSAAVIHDGELVYMYHKHFLPNYGVFDENRYFQAGCENPVFQSNGCVFGVSVCEDIWYPDGPPEIQASMCGAEILFNLSSSPYHIGKGLVRERMLSTRAADNTAFVVYCNLVGGQDELIFDGHSVVCGPQGEIIARGKQFQEELLIADLDLRQVFRWRLSDPRRRKTTRKNSSDTPRIVLKECAHNPAVTPIPAAPESPLETVAEVYQALVMGTRDFVLKNGFRKVVLGLSGGIDSAITAVIAADALGPENVEGVAMPTRYSSGHSLEDAERLAQNLGISFRVIPIDETFQSYLDMLAPSFEGKEPDTAEENLQSRIRGVTLMALSNKFGWLVLTTGNKSEVAVGYSTLYGDTAGGFSVIKDVPKTLVYELSRYRNVLAGYDLIPQQVIDKAPSAELRPDQKDTDSLLPYDELDPILHAYIEKSMSIEDIANLGYSKEDIIRTIRLVDRSEYKRRQSPPGIKISSRAFGKDWRVPITNRYGKI
ncbi:MAG: NAD+ synthase [Candidatus Latescibacterota bacterium]